MTAEFLGFKEELRCMSYWPVVYHVKHVAAFRKYGTCRGAAAAPLPH